MTAALLATADGAVFRGRSVGAPGLATGEVIFNTAMSGYQEIVTDPSYAGQVVVMTSSHIGNYGVTGADDQSARPRCAGVVVRSMAARPSSWRATGALPEYLAAHGVVAISDVDTRRLTRHIRVRGAMAVAVGTDASEAELLATAAAAPPLSGRDLVATVTTGGPYEIAAAGERVGSVVAYDFGIKRDILSRLAGRGLDVTVVPADTPAATVLGLDPDGVFLSNGPGDPEPLTAAVAAVRGLLGEVPVFGICLGHQVLGLALGARTYKMPFGHHGGNHPVRRLSDGRVAVTAQNHGFAVDLWPLTGQAPPARTGLADPGLLPASVPTDFGEAVPTHQNLNDGTLEGMACRDIPAFSVQYHPEAAPGPHDATGLFDDFLRLMGVPAGGAGH